MENQIVRVGRDGKVSLDAVPDPAQKKVKLNFARLGASGRKEWSETWSFAEFKTEFPEYLNDLLVGRKIGAAIGEGEYLTGAVLRDSEDTDSKGVAGDALPAADAKTVRAFLSKAIRELQNAADSAIRDQFGAQQEIKVVLAQVMKLAMQF